MSNDHTVTNTTAAQVVDFWRDAGAARWFRKDEAFDAQFRERFLATHEAAARGELNDWRDSANGSLALLILLDQFPRNSFRNTARMFATDAMAREVARAAIDAGFDRQIAAEMRAFMYLPFEHSESVADQDRSIELTAGLDNETKRYAVMHRDIISRFGRFPHRNAVLGRVTTPDEQKFLDEGGFAG